MQRQTMRELRPCVRLRGQDLRRTSDGPRCVHAAAAVWGACVGGLRGCGDNGVTRLPRSWRAEGGTLARDAPATILSCSSALALRDAARESRLAARLLDAADRRLRSASASSSLDLRLAFRLSTS